MVEDSFTGDFSAKVNKVMEADLKNYLFLEQRVADSNELAQPIM